ncbi:MAG: hypothetical protein WAV07_03025 [Candidatus Contendobacter sp.]
MGSSTVLVELAPQGGFRPVKLAGDWLETIYDQSVGFKSGPRHGWLHKNSRRTYMNGNMKFAGLVTFFGAKRNSAQPTFLHEEFGKLCELQSFLKNPMLNNFR